MTQSLLDQFPKNEMTREEEAALVTRRTEAALNELVMANMREALLYTGRVCDGKLSEGERVSLCYQEMMMSAPRFKPGRLRFFAFAKAGLRGRMKTYWTSLKPVRNAETVSLDELEKTPPEKFCQSRSRDDDPETSFREDKTGEIEHPNLDTLFVKEHLQKIRTALHGCLSDQQWMIINLVYQSNLNFPQVAKLLGMTRSGVHVSHRKAIAKLRDGLAQNPRLL